MKKGSLPIPIAITGHRDLRSEDVPALQDQLRKIFTDLEERYPSSPLVLLSSLAEGADRLAAHIALSMGIKLICPLPLPRKIYEDDFVTEESRVEFAYFLDKAEEWFELPLLSNVSLEDVREDGVERNHQYAYVGAYLARHSQIIIALWDGSAVELVGGTTYIVGFKLRGIPPPYITLQGRFDPEEIGPVYHILTPRRSHNTPEGKPGAFRILYPNQFRNDEMAKQSYDRILKNTDRFNEDELRFWDQLADDRERTSGYLLSDSSKSNENKHSASLTSLFSISDTLAVFFQRKTLQILTVLLTFALAATAVFELYAYLMIGYPVLLLLFFAIIALASGIYAFSAKKGYQEKFQDYRTLAEGLRVQFYWKFIGIQYSAANYYLGDQHSELDWIRHALRIWSLPFSEEAKKKQQFDTHEERERWKLLLQNWVVSQANYFTRSSIRESAKVKRISIWARLLLVMGFALIAFNMIYQYYIGFIPLESILYISSVTPIAAGLLYGYIEKRALSDHVKQYERMSNLFSRAKQHLEHLISEMNYGEARKLVFDLGKEALKENGRWIITHRERPIEFPITK